MPPLLDVVRSSVAAVVSSLSALSPIAPPAVIVNLDAATLLVAPFSVSITAPEDVITTSRPVAVIVLARSTGPPCRVTVPLDLTALVEKSTALTVILAVPSALPMFNVSTVPMLSAVNSA